MNRDFLRAVAWTLALLAAALCVQWARATVMVPQCGPPAQMHAFLKQRFGEEPVKHENAYTLAGRFFGIVEWTENPKHPATWSLLITADGGVTCIALSGDKRLGFQL